MKVIKITQNQNFQLIPQNPNANADYNIQLQNLQNAQAALDYFESVINASQQAESSLRNLEEVTGMDLNLTTQFQGLIKQAMTSSPAFNLLAQMNFISSVDDILDANQITSIKSIINNNMQATQQVI